VLKVKLDFDKKFYEEIIENLNDGLYIVDTNRVIKFWNKAAERLTGFTAEEVAGSSCSDNILMHVDEEGNSLCKGRCPIVYAFETGKGQEAEVYLHHKDGHRVPVWIRVGLIRDKNGNIIGASELFSDLSSREAYRLKVAELESIAMLDALTGLPNRYYMEREINSRIEERKRLGVPFGILFMDIDHFKHFNDTYGHDVGDKVLKMVAQTFVSNSRPFDVYARWGGEEFLAVIRNVDVVELEKIGNRMRMLVGESFIMHEGKKLKVTISVGATLFQDGDTLESVVKRADTLLYESKNAGRNRITVG